MKQERDDEEISLSAAKKEKGKIAGERARERRTKLAIERKTSPYILSIPEIVSKNQNLREREWGGRRRREKLGCPSFSLSLSF